MTDLVALEEELGAHDAFFVEDVGPWEGDSGEIVRAEFLSVHGLVADAVGVDGLAAFVGEKQVGDAVLFGIALDRIDGVVADGNERDSRGFNFFDVFLQLDQLPLAVGSPIGRSEKRQRDGSFFREVAQGVLGAVEVGECEVGGFLAHFDSSYFLGRPFVLRERAACEQSSRHECR